jgi:hypothetical protein
MSRLMLPINNWEKPLRVSEVAIDRNRPPSGTGLVYVVSGVPDPAKDIRFVGSGHCAAATDGLARIGTLIGAMLGFDLWHYGGIKLYKNYSADQINHLYVIWALIDGCPILAERALRLHHLNHPTESPEFQRLDGGEPNRNAVCNRICIPQNLGWRPSSERKLQAQNVSGLFAK